MIVSCVFPDSVFLPLHAALPENVEAGLEDGQVEAVWERSGDGTAVAGGPGGHKVRGFG